MAAARAADERPQPGHADAADEPQGAPAGAAAAAAAVRDAPRAGRRAAAARRAARRVPPAQGDVQQLPADAGRAGRPHQALRAPHRGGPRLTRHLAHRLHQRRLSGQPLRLHAGRRGDRAPVRADGRAGEGAALPALFTDGLRLGRHADPAQPDDGDAGAVGEGGGAPPLQDANPAGGARAPDRRQRPRPPAARPPRLPHRAGGAARRVLARPERRRRDDGARHLPPHSGIPLPPPLAPHSGVPPPCRCETSFRSTTSFRRCSRRSCRAR